MKRRMLGLMGCVAGTLILSTMSGGCETMNKSVPQHAHDIDTVIDYEARQLVEDIDYALMIDRPSRLTKWHVQ